MFGGSVPGGGDAIGPTSVTGTGLIALASLTVASQSNQLPTHPTNPTRAAPVSFSRTAGSSDMSKALGTKVTGGPAPANFSASKRNLWLYRKCTFELAQISLSIMLCGMSN